LRYDKRHYRRPTRQNSQTRATRGDSGDNNLSLFESPGDRRQVGDGKKRDFGNSVLVTRTSVDFCENIENVIENNRPNIQPGREETERGLASARCDIDWEQFWKEQINTAPKCGRCGSDKRFVNRYADVFEGIRHTVSVWECRKCKGDKQC
jgi:hypothetical protein